MAAAVSDFYIPHAELSHHKIDSREEDGLTLKLSKVPKRLGEIKSWAPDAKIISFKLETDTDQLEPKALRSIELYNVDFVVANLLQTRY